MTRESRLILVLLVLAGVGISGLMVVANQYRKALAGTGRPVVRAAEEPRALAARHVEGFLAARAAANAVVGKDPGSIESLSAEAEGSYRSARLQALASYRMSYDDYVAVRAAWGRVRSGIPLDDAALQAAFNARRAALDAEGSSAAEALDEAIR